MARRDAWLYSAASGSAFLVSLLAVEWPFASFLLSPASRNWFFGSHYVDFMTPPSSRIATFQFLDMDRGDFWTNLALALFFAILMTRLGIERGESLRRVRR